LRSTHRDVKILASAKVREGAVRVAGIPLFHPNKISKNIRRDNMRATGYSGTPLPQKLGIKAGFTVCVRGAPERYDRLVRGLPPDVRIGLRITARTHFVHVFSSERAQLSTELLAARAKLRDDAMIWVSWPKKASGMPTDITEDVVREIAFPLGLVDVKVCAVDQTWSGLKLVVRKKNRRSERLA
jgi:hypothetical protein